MKIATYNVNGVNGRLPVLLRWLKEAQPDVVCLQELNNFPISAIRKAGYGAVWHTRLHERPSPFPNKDGNGFAMPWLVLRRHGAPNPVRRQAPVAWAAPPWPGR
jgi:endonuclease/exonuclease/phosphatase family metal-dependent hydrolase